MNKIKSTIICIALCLVMGVVSIVPSFLFNDKKLSARYINVNEIGTLSYEEKVDQILSGFSDYSASVDEDIICFDGDIEISENSLSQLSFVVSMDAPVIKKYSTRLDMENQKFYIITKYEQEGVVIHNEEIEAEPIYDELSDDYYIFMPDGSKASVKELITQDNLDECVVITATATATYAIVALLAITVVVNAPTIIEDTVTVVEAVVTWVKSFISWFKSLFKKKTTYITTTTIVTTLTPSITIAGSKIETVALTKEETVKLKVNMYYLCFADPTNGKMYVSISTIDYNVALMIMTNPILVPCIGNDKKDMIASVYTVNQFTAFELASDAGIANSKPECHGSDYYMHYHSIFQIRTRQKDLARPHAFFTVITL